MHVITVTAYFEKFINSYFNKTSLDNTLEDKILVSYFVCCLSY